MASKPPPPPDWDAIPDTSRRASLRASVADGTVDAELARMLLDHQRAIRKNGNGWRRSIATVIVAALLGGGGGYGIDRVTSDAEGTLSDPQCDRLRTDLAAHTGTVGHEGLRGRIEDVRNDVTAIQTAQETGQNALEDRLTKIDDRLERLDAVIADVRWRLR